MNTPLVNALGATLFHFLWEGLAIALLLRLCSASARIHYRLACAALLAMPLAFFVTLWLVMPEGALRFPLHDNLYAAAAAVLHIRTRNLASICSHICTNRCVGLCPSGWPA